MAVDPYAEIAALTGTRPRETTPLSGGDISALWRAQMPDGAQLVLKLADNAGAEAEMLEAMARAGVPVPRVIAARSDAFVMEAVEEGGRLQGAAWDRLADVLLALHGARGDAFGWAGDHAFGALPIPNGFHENWPRFWAENRLLPSVAHVDAGIACRIETLAARIGEVLPDCPAPALLHGDLWGGNVLIGANGEVAALIDPACYYGHREVDWAMLTLFNDPPGRFFAAMAPEPGWRERQPVYRLWPLLVHLRLFGGTYRGSVEAALSAVGA